MKKRGLFAFLFYLFINLLLAAALIILSTSSQQGDIYSLALFNFAIYSSLYLLPIFATPLFFKVLQFHGGIKIRFQPHVAAKLGNVGRAFFFVAVRTEVLGIDADEIAQQFKQAILFLFDQRAEFFCIHHFVTS